MAEENFIYLYKYLPFNEGSLCVLKNGTLKYTCPLDFNDPFDCRPSYNEQSLSQIDISKRKLIHEIGKRNNLSPAKRIMEKKKVASQLKGLIDRGELLERLLSSVGVVSLSADPLNILMWSHYADFHRGFVVEFKIPLEGSTHLVRNAKNLVALEVQYEQYRPEVKYGLESHNETLQKTILTKSLLWSYEKEHRVIDIGRGPGIHKYNRDNLVHSVVVGMRMAESEQKCLSEIVSQLRRNEGLEHLKLYRAQAAKKEYKITIPEHPKWDDASMEGWSVT